MAPFTIFAGFGECQLSTTVHIVKDIVIIVLALAFFGWGLRLGIKTRKLKGIVIIGLISAVMALVLYGFLVVFTYPFCAPLEWLPQ